MKKESVGKLQMFSASLIRGSSQSTFTKIIDTSIFNLTFYRIFLAGLIIYIFDLFNNKKIKNIFAKDKLKYHLLSLFIGVRFFLFYLGYKIGSITLGTIVFFSFGVFIAILEPYFLENKLDKRNLFLSIICFLGIMLALSNKATFENESIFLGAVVMFFAMLMVLIERILKKKWIHNITNREWAFYQNFAASIMFLPAIFIFPFPTLNTMLLIVVFTLLTGVIAFLLDMSSLRKIKLSSNSIIAYTEPFVAILIGIIIFNEQLTIQIIIGGVLVFGSLMFVRK